MKASLVSGCELVKVAAFFSERSNLMNHVRCKMAPAPVCEGLLHPQRLATERTSAAAETGDDHGVGCEPVLVLCHARKSTSVAAWDGIQLWCYRPCPLAEPSITIRRRSGNGAVRSTAVALVPSLHSVDTSFNPLLMFDYRVYGVEI